MQEPGFWDDQNHARDVAKEREDLAKELEQWTTLTNDVDELFELEAIANQEHDTKIQHDIDRQLKNILQRYDALELQLFFSGAYDHRSAYVTIHAGSGGTDAQDWSEMLLRMYLRFFERQGWQASIIEEARGKEAGIKRVMIHVIGRYVYGMLKTEAGVHRLVRISPFDAEKMRHTSFALVEVTPEFEEVDDVKLDEKDITIETSTSSGHGGQSVNTTYSAIRVVHIPTGITVSCQNERSQKQNKETALKILKAKLFVKALEERQKEKKELRGEYKSAEWGNQIRSYVLHPYTLVKDHRTKFEIQDVQRVLDGDILPFIEHYLRTQK
jgi:peptide chain release factor 2